MQERAITLDLGRAFSFVFDDPEWVKKILVGGLILLAGFIIPILPGLVLYGYALEITHRVYQGRSDALPEWDDIGGYFVRGFLLSVAIFFWLMPVILLITCVAGGVAVAASVSGEDVIAVFSGFILFGLLGVMFLLLLLWTVAILPIIAGRYAVEERFGAMFEFGEIMQEVRRVGAGPLLILLLTVIVAGFISQLGFVLCFVGVAFTSFYSYLVIAHGAGQVYRRARGMDVPPTATTSLAAF